MCFKYMFGIIINVVELGVVEMGEIETISLIKMSYGCECCRLGMNEWPIKVWW